MALKGLPTLWEKGEGNSSATGVAPANVPSEQPLQGNKAAGIASNQSVVISVGKDNTLSPDRQDGAGNEGRGGGQTVLCGDRGGFGYGFDHSGGILATEDVFFAVFEGDRETVGGFAVVGDIFAEVFLFEPAIPAEPFATVNDPYCPHSRRTQSDRGDV